MGTAWALHRAWPQAELHVSPASGHAYDEPETLDRLIGATDRLALDLVRGGASW